jgi:predicted RNA-binding protein YlxR (DUF448 family)
MRMSETRVKESAAARSVDVPRETSRTRTCVGCGERVEIAYAGGAPSSLIRLVLGPGGEVAVDAAGGSFGRGAHVHPRPACLEKAVQRGLSRAAKGKVSALRLDAEEGGAEATVPLDAGSLARAIVGALERRVRGLLVAASRARAIAPGADAATSADRVGDAKLFVVASDAAAGAELGVVRRAVAEGRAVAWGTKQVLGALCSSAGSAKRTEGLSVVVIKDDRIAGAIQAAVLAASAITPVAARRAHATYAEAGHKRHDALRPDASGGDHGAARSEPDRRADG